MFELKINKLHLAIIIIISAYLNISLVPGSDLLIVSMTFVFLSIFFVRLKVFDYIFVSFIVIFQIFVYSTVWIFYGNVYEQLLSIAQLSLSIFLGVVSYRLFLNNVFVNNIKYIKHMNIIFICLIVLEFLGVTETLSNYYRIYFLGVTQDIISIEQTRDIAMTGWTHRPNVFAKEASLAYLFFFTISSCFLVHQRKLSNFFIFLLINAAMFIIYRTPSVVLAFIVYFLVLFNSKEQFLENLNKKYHMIFNVVFIMIVLTFSYSTTDVFLERFSKIDFSDVHQLNSITIRVVAPIKFAKEVMNDYPLLGIGVGNLSLFTSEGKVVGNNALLYFFSFFGIIGTSSVFLLFIIWLFKEGFKPGEVLVATVFIICIALQTGAILNFRMWFYIFLFIAFYKNSKVRNSGMILSKSGCT